LDDFTGRMSTVVGNHRQGANFHRDLNEARKSFTLEQLAEEESTHASSSQNVGYDASQREKNPSSTYLNNTSSHSASRNSGEGSKKITFGDSVNCGTTGGVYGRSGTCTPPRRPSNTSSQLSSGVSSVNSTTSHSQNSASAKLNSIFGSGNGGSGNGGSGSSSDTTPRSFKKKISKFFSKPKIFHRHPHRKSLDNSINSTVDQPPMSRSASDQSRTDRESHHQQTRRNNSTGNNRNRYTVSSGGRK